MNKKQLIVAWTMGILVIISILVAMLFDVRFVTYIDDKGILSGGKEIAWGDVLKHFLASSVTILILGSLSIYTLRDKKK